MESKKARIAEQAASHPGTAPESGDSAAHLSSQPIQILRGRIGQNGCVQVGPELFDRIQLRGVGGQRLDGEPVAVAGQGVASACAAVGRQPIPEQDHRAPTMAAERVEEAHDLGTADVSAMQAQQPARTPTVSPHPHRADPRQPFPVERLDQPRRLPTRRPSGPDRRTLGEGALVHKDQPSLQLCGVFFTCGQRTRTQWAMAFWLRSRARRAGRWRLQPRARSTRQTCRG